MLARWTKRLRRGTYCLALGVSICGLGIMGSAAEAQVPADEEPAAAGSSGEASVEEDWQLVERNDEPGEAYELWARVPPDSKWRAFRLIGDVDVPPGTAADVAMDVSADETRATGRQSRRLLLRTPDVVVNYMRVDFPLVADRDVTTRLERTYDPERDEYRLVWREANDEGPSLEEGVVRMPLARGSWTFRPLPGGRTRVVFESHADLGGSLPAWIINPVTTGTVKSNIIDLRAAIARRGE